MELSQTSLAMLLLSGIPLGAALSIIYVLTDFSGLSYLLFKRILQQVKDFIFAFFAGIVAVLLVYFINAGQSRYLVLLGLVMGFVLTYRAFSKPLLRTRNALLRVLVAPISLIWSFTLGRLIAKVRMAKQIKMTEKKGRIAQQLASNGF